MDKKLIYLAVPYSDDNKETRLERFELVTRLSALLLQQFDIALFSPITHSHIIGELMPEKYRIPSDFAFNFWAKGQDTVFLDLSDELWVFMLSGWNKSKGVIYEINRFKETNKGELISYLSEHYLEV